MDLYLPSAGGRRKKVIKYNAVLSFISRLVRPPLNFIYIYNFKNEEPPLKDILYPIKLTK